MVLRFFLILPALAWPISTPAATLGLTCNGKATLVVAPDAVDAEMCAAKQQGVCIAQFSRVQGYFALAETQNGGSTGLAGGDGALSAAEDKALSSCEALGAGSCVIVQSGRDDGNNWLNCSRG